jgi:hypothetical protein
LQRKKKIATFEQTCDAMNGDILPRPPARVRGRPFERRQSGDPRRQRGSRNEATLAAAALLAGEAKP